MATTKKESSAGQTALWFLAILVGLAILGAIGGNHQSPPQVTYNVSAPAPAPVQPAPAPQPAPQPQSAAFMPAPPPPEPQERVVYNDQQIIERPIIRTRDVLVGSTIRAAGQVIGELIERHRFQAPFSNGSYGYGWGGGQGVIYVVPQSSGRLYGQNQGRQNQGQQRQNQNQGRQQGRRR